MKGALHPTARLVEAGQRGPGHEMGERTYVSEDPVPRLRRGDAPTVKNVGYSERDLGENFVLFQGRHPWGVGVSATAFVSDGEAAVFDTLLHPSEGRRMARSLRERGLRVKAVVISHWHIDHIGGNRFFPGRILAHQLARKLWKTALPGHLQWAKETYRKEFRDFVPSPPTEFFIRRATIPVGKERAVAVHIPGHTPDSIALLVPGARTVLVGDAVNDLPVFDDSRGYLRSLRTLQKMPVDTVVQGHGPPVPRTKLGRDIDYLERCRAAVRAARGSPASRAKALEFPLEMFVGGERARELAPAWTWVHRENLEKISREFDRAPWTR